MTITNYEFTLIDLTFIIALWLYNNPFFLNSMFFYLLNYASTKNLDYLLLPIR